MFTTLLMTITFGLSQNEPTLILRNRPQIVQAEFHPDGKRVFCVTHAGLEAYDTSTGKLLFDAPSGRMLVVSPKGDKLALISTNIGMISIDGTVTVLDGDTGKVLRQVSGTSALFSPDGRWLISHSGYNVGHPATDLPPKVQITNLETGKTHLAKLRDFDDKKALSFGMHRAAGNFHFTKDGKSLASLGGGIGQRKIWAACDLATGEPLEKLPGVDQVEVVYRSPYSVDGKRYVNQWTVHDAEEGKPIAKLEMANIKANGWRNTFYMSPDGKTIYGESSNHWREPETDGKRFLITRTSQLHAWDADTGKWQRTVAEANVTHTMPAVTQKKLGNAYREDPHFALNHDATRAIDYTADGAVAVWDLKTGKILRKMRQSGHSARPEMLAFSPDSNWLASASSDGEVLIWNAKTGEPMRILDRAAYLSDIRFRPKSKELIGLGQDQIYVWNFESGELLRTIERKGFLFRLECHPDGKRVAVSEHQSDTTALLDIDSGKVLHSFTGKGQSLMFHPDGKSLMALHPSGAVSIWDIDSGKRKHYWFGGKSGDYRYRAHVVRFLGEGSQFVLCENDTATVFDSNTAKQISQHTLKMQAWYAFQQMSVHPDGKRVVIGPHSSHDVHEFELFTGKVLRTYPGHGHVTSRVQFSPDGTRLATAGEYDFVIRIHSVPAARIEK